MSGSNDNQFCQFFNSAAPQQQPGFPTPQPPQRLPGVDALVHNLEYSFIDILELVGDDDDECCEPAPSPQQATFNTPPPPAVAPGVVGQVPSGFNPALYQQYLHQRQSHIQQGQQAQQQQQQQQQQQAQQLWAQQPSHQGPIQGTQQR